MKKNVFLVVFVMLVIGVSVLYAQTNANLKPGVYRTSGAPGEARIVISNVSHHTSGRKNVVVYAPDGSVHARGSARITGSRVNVDYGDHGFETFTIVDEETFIADNSYTTWVWVRNYRRDEL